MVSSMTQPQLLSSMFIVATAVSIVLKILKARYGSLTAWKSKLVLVILSLTVGAIYNVLAATGLLATAYTILATSSTVYALFLKEN